MSPMRSLLLLTLTFAACTSEPSNTTDGGADLAGHSADLAAKPNPIVAACDSLAPVGTWENITPPEVQTVLNTGMHGVFAFVVDPVNAGTVYLGTIQLGLWKTTDCGAHFTKISGRGATALNGGMNWTMVMDPQDSQVLYTNAGYGAGSNGLFRSANGGADWDVIWPPSDPALSGAFNYNFANTVDMDPQDHRHLLLSFHEACLNRPSKNCIAETKDAGATWTLLNGDKRWTSDGEGVRALFLDDSKTWLWDSQADGAWRSTDAGATWTQIITQSANHLQSTQMYRALDGTYLLGGMGDLWRSPVGTSNGTWVKDDKLMGPLPGGIVSDGTTIYASNCYYGSFCGAGTKDFYFTAPENDNANWKPMASPGIGVMNAGGVLGYDRSHHILYSSNLGGGFWRVVTK